MALDMMDPTLITRVHVVEVLVHAVIILLANARFETLSSSYLLTFSTLMHL